MERGFDIVTIVSAVCVARYVAAAVGDVAFMNSGYPARRFAAERKSLMIGTAVAMISSANNSARPREGQGKAK
jgi:hypothetical protein